jgi:hypothetical protein
VVAGELARRLRDLGPGPWFGVPDEEGGPFGSCTDDAVEHMAVTFAGWFDRALRLGCLTEAEQQLAEWAREHADVYAGEVPVPVSRDYTPGNWLVDAAGNFVGVIDLENTLWGVALDPFPRLWARYFLACPGAEAAFIAGYGTDLPRERPLQVRHLTISVGIADLVLGTELGRSDYVERGRSSLGRLAAPLKRTDLTV